MGNIAPFIEKIKSAVYGKDVRQSICDALESSNTTSETAEANSVEAKEVAENSQTGAKAYYESTKALADTISGTVGIDDTQTTTSTTWSSEAIASAQGRNLIPYPYLFQKATNRGLTFEANENGGIVSSGTGTEKNLMPFCTINSISTKAKKSIPLKADTWYTISSVRTSEYAIGVTVYFMGDDLSHKVLTYECRYGDVSTTLTKDNVYQIQDGIVYDKVSFKLPEDAYASIHIRYKAGTDVTVDNDIIYPMLEEGLEAHACEYTTESNVTLKKYIDTIAGDAYDETKAYTSGEYVIYRNTLYKCIANTTAGVLPNNTTYFTNTTFGAELASLWNAIQA